MAEQAIQKPSRCATKQTGLVHHVGWNEALDAIERYMQRKLDIIDDLVDTEVKSLSEEAEKIFASLYSEDSLQESIEVDKYEAIAKAQQKLSKIYKEGPASKLAVIDELKTMVDDCLELFDFNQSRFEKFSNVPIEGKMDNNAVIEAAVYSPCLALCIMAFTILVLV